MLTVKRLKECLHYDPKIGVWTRLRSKRSDRVGKRAGGICDGYLWIKIDGQGYMAHRLAFLYMTGAWPIDEADHRNLSRIDCRWSNLRSATRRQNQGNVRVRSDNRVGLKGVTFLKRQNSFQSRIVLANGRREFIGSFDSAKAASRAYQKRMREVFGEFGRA
jgi:hypothetical protein